MDAPDEWRLGRIARTDIGYFHHAVAGTHAGTGQQDQARAEDDKKTTAAPSSRNVCALWLIHTRPTDGKISDRIRPRFHDRFFARRFFLAAENLSCK